MQQFKMVNSNLLISMESNKILSNEIIMKKDTAGRKEIVYGVVVNGKDFIGMKAYFPYYASSPLRIDHKEYLIVSLDDVIMFEELNK